MPSAEPLRRVLEAAEAVDRAIDARASSGELAALRRALDESFAVVLDVLGDSGQTGFRAALVSQYARLCGSLDAFERHTADPA